MLANSVAWYKICPPEAQPRVRMAKFYGENEAHFAVLLRHFVDISIIYISPTFCSI